MAKMPARRRKAPDHSSAKAKAKQDWQDGKLSHGAFKDIERSANRKMRRPNDHDADDVPGAQPSANDYDADDM